MEGAHGTLTTFLIVGLIRVAVANNVANRKLTNMSTAHSAILFFRPNKLASVSSFLSIV